MWFYLQKNIVLKPKDGSFVLRPYSFFLYHIVSKKEMQSIFEVYGKKLVTVKSAGLNCHKILQNKYSDFTCNSIG